MSFRFYKRIKIIDGLTLNLSKRNISTSIGVRGFHYTTGTAGDRVTLGLTGTGLFWTKKIKKSYVVPEIEPVKGHSNIFKIAVFICIGFFIVMVCYT
jgi:hypothetical protein